LHVILDRVSRQIGAFELAQAAGDYSAARATLAEVLESAYTLAGRAMDLRDLLARKQAREQASADAKAKK
jgi:hypothetical protein